MVIKQKRTAEVQAAIRRSAHESPLRGGVKLTLKKALAGKEVET